MVLVRVGPAFAAAAVTAATPAAAVTAAADAVAQHGPAAANGVPAVAAVATAVGV